jgi:hypothetical protein
MKVTVRTCEFDDYREAIEITTPKNGVSFYDGEPEDSNLGRNFCDVYQIPALMKEAYEAGKNGETFEIENIEVDEI